jgi:hypothetical protein
MNIEIAWDKKNNRFVAYTVKPIVVGVGVCVESAERDYRKKLHARIEDKLNVAGKQAGVETKAREQKAKDAEKYRELKGKLTKLEAEYKVLKDYLKDYEKEKAISQLAAIAKEEGPYTN